MKITKIQKGLVLLTVTAATFAVGCELIVDFDRTKIPVDDASTPIPDVSVPETTTPTPDAGTEAGTDAGDAGETDAADASDAADANDQ